MSELTAPVGLELYNLATELQCIVQIEAQLRSPRQTPPFGSTPPSIIEAPISPSKPKPEPKRQSVAQLVAENTDKILASIGPRIGGRQAEHTVRDSDDEEAPDNPDSLDTFSNHTVSWAERGKLFQRISTERTGDMLNFARQWLMELAKISCFENREDLGYFVEQLSIFTALHSNRPWPDIDYTTPLISTNDEASHVPLTDAEVKENWEEVQSLLMALGGAAAMRLRACDPVADKNIKTTLRIGNELDYTTMRNKMLAYRRLMISGRLEDLMLRHFRAFVEEEAQALQNYDAHVNRSRFASISSDPEEVKAIEEINAEQEGGRGWDDTAARPMIELSPKLQDDLAKAFAGLALKFGPAGKENEKLSAGQN